MLSIGLPTASKTTPITVTQKIPIKGPGAAIPNSNGINRDRRISPFRSL
jgi:hypothetical protein